MMGEYQFRGFTIPGHMMESLVAYIEDRRPVGHFLTAILQNDLKEAVARADDHNLANLPAYIGYLYNSAPSPCWGSPQKVAKWLAKETDNGL